MLPSPRSTGHKANHGEATNASYFQKEIQVSKNSTRTRADKARLRNRRNTQAEWKDRGYVPPVVHIGGNPCYAMSDLRKLGMPEESALGLTAGCSVDHATDTYYETIGRQQ